MRIANVRKLMRMARDYESAEGRDLRGFLEFAEFRAGLDDEPVAADRGRGPRRGAGDDDPQRQGPRVRGRRGPLARPPPARRLPARRCGSAPRARRSRKVGLRLARLGGAPAAAVRLRRDLRARRRSSPPRRSDASSTSPRPGPRRRLILSGIRPERPADRAGARAPRSSTACSPAPASPTLADGDLVTLAAPATPDGTRCEPSPRRSSWSGSTPPSAEQAARAGRLRLAADRAPRRARGPPPILTPPSPADAAPSALLLGPSRARALRLSLLRRAGAGDAAAARAGQRRRRQPQRALRLRQHRPLAAGATPPAGDWIDPPTDWSAARSRPRGWSRRAEADRGREPAGPRLDRLGAVRRAGRPRHQRSGPSCRSCSSWAAPSSAARST